MDGPVLRVSEHAAVRAVILTSQRTEALYLAECLASHPEIHCASEILNGQPDSPIPPPHGRFRHIVTVARIARTGAWLPAFRLEQFYSRGTDRVRCFNFIYDQHANPFALSYLMSHREIRVIHLSRANLLEAYVSNLLMQNRHALLAIAPDAPVRIHVDPFKTIAAMRKARMHHGYYEALFGRHARLSLSYELLFDGPYLRTDTASRICDFLGVSSQPMRSGLARSIPASLRAAVTNYDELAEAVSCSEFADMLTAGD